MPTLLDPVFTCCFCGKEYTGFGNKLTTVKKDSDTKKCCDTCYWEYVVPMRINKVLMEKDQV